MSHHFRQGQAHISNRLCLSGLAKCPVKTDPAAAWAPPDGCHIRTNRDKKRLQKRHIPSFSQPSPQA